MKLSILCRFIWETKHGHKTLNAIHLKDIQKYWTVAGAMLKAILLDSVNCPTCVCTNHNDIAKYSISNFKRIGHKEIATLMLAP